MKEKDIDQAFKWKKKYYELASHFDNMRALHLELQEKHLVLQDKYENILVAFTTSMKSTKDLLNKVNANIEAQINKEVK